MPDPIRILVVDDLLHPDPTLAAAFVQKPFTLESLAQTVRSALDERKPTAAN